MAHVGFLIWFQMVQIWGRCIVADLTRYIQMRSVGRAYQRRLRNLSVTDFARGIVARIHCVLIEGVSSTLLAFISNTQIGLSEMLPRTSGGHGRGKGFVSIVMADDHGGFSCSCKFVHQQKRSSIEHGLLDGSISKDDDVDKMRCR